MHPLSQVVVDRVRRKVGERFDWVAAFDHIRRLDDLARAIDCPPAADKASLLDAPVKVGDVAFYRLSYAAMALIEERFSLLDGHFFDLAVAWASAHARDPGALRQMFGCSEREARKTVLAWARSMRCSFAAVVAVVRDLIRTENGDESTDEPVGFGSVVSTLIEAYGQDAEYWTFASVDEIRQRLVDRAVRADHDRRELARETKRAIAPDPDSYMARAQIRFNKAAQEFESWALKRWPA